MDVSGKNPKKISIKMGVHIRKNGVYCHFLKQTSSSFRNTCHLSFPEGAYFQVGFDRRSGCTAVTEYLQQER